MNIWKRLLALCAALMLVCACALAEDAADEEDLVLATVNGVEIKHSEVDNMAYLFYYYGYTQTYPDYDFALEYLIQQEVINNHLHVAGYDQFTEDERAAFANEASAEWQAALNDYMEDYLTEDTEEARATLLKQAAEYYASYGQSEERLLEELLTDEARNRLEDDLLDGYAPTEAEISEVFATYGAQYQQQYENNVGLYEYYVNYMGYESWYVPEGYRAVLHILLDVDDELLTAYADAQGAYDECASAETPDEAATAAAKKSMEDARAAVIASCQESLDDIYARLEKGEDFRTLIAQYGQDPGMKDESLLEEGYRVHAQSIMYDQAFTDGAFQERMTKPGDYSDPVVGQNGVHVIYYLADEPSGLIMTDAIHEEIEEYLISEHLNEAYNDAYNGWLEAVTVERNAENLAIVKAKAEEAAQDIDAQSDGNDAAEDDATNDSDAANEGSADGTAQ